MSNFMDFLKTSESSSKNNRLASESFAEKKQEKKLKIKNYHHGNSVLITKAGDAFKGYYGHVTDFFPATYELKTDGETYIEAEKIMNQDLSKKVMTRFGESKVLEKISALQKGAEYIEFIIYVDSETLKQKIGLYVDDTNLIINYLESQGNDSNEAYMTRENKNNNFVRELNQDDLVEMMIKLRTDSIEELIDGINSVNLNDKTDSLIQVLKNSVESWSLDDATRDMELENGYPVIQKITDFLFNKKISIVFNKDVIGNRHYMVTSGEYKGWTNIYKPTLNYYKIQYESVVKYKPGEIKVDKLNRKYAVIKKGDNAGKKYLIVKYNKAKLSVRLMSNDREIICEPSDVFYFDIKLKNGNVAEVVDTLLGNELEIKEKMEKTEFSFRTSIISEYEIDEKLSGFTLSDTENQKEQPITNIYDNMLNQQDIEQDRDEVYDEVYDDDEEKSESGNYEDEQEDHELEREDNIEPESNEGQAKDSFKDTERTSKVMIDLTSKQQEILNMIKKASKLFGYYVEEYDVLSKTEDTIECLKKILKKSSVSDYNIRFILVLVIIYEAIKGHIDHDLDKTINKIFKGENSKGFFSAKDLSPENINNFIFFDNVFGNANDIISSIKTLTNEPTFNKNKQILKELLLYADVIVQKCLGFNLSIRRKYEMDVSKLIPIGINRETGRRLKDEKEDSEMAKLKKLRQQFYTSKNILDNVIVPQKEVEIKWDHDSKKVLDKFSKGLEKKARQQPEASKIILTIKDNLYRAPFAIRDDILDRSTRSNFETVFLKLKGCIIQYKEDNSAIIKYEHQRIDKNRKRIYEEKEGTDMDIDTDEPEAEVKLSKKQKLYNIERSLKKAQVAANKHIYSENKESKKDKKTKESKKDTKDSEDTEDTENSEDTEN